MCDASEKTPRCKLLAPKEKEKKKKILGQKKCNIYLVQETSEDEQNIQKELQLLKSSIDKHSLQRVEDKTINYKNI